MIVIVGGGPSAGLSGLGREIDRQFVVRMKHAVRDPVHRGLRMDAYFSRGYSARKPNHDFWYFPKRPPHADGCNSAHWLSFYAKFSRGKPSTGLCALFCAAEFFPGAEVGLIGYDNVLDEIPFRAGPHDCGGEHACVAALPLTVFDLRTEHGQTHLRHAKPTENFEFRRPQPQLPDRGSEPRTGSTLEGLPLRLAGNEG